MYVYSSRGAVNHCNSEVVSTGSVYNAKPCTVVHIEDLLLEVGDQVVVVLSMRSGQRFIKRCKAAKTAAGTGTILAK